MTGNVFSLPNTSMPNKIALNSDPRFLEIARPIEGWSGMESQTEQLALEMSALLAPMPPRATDAQLAQRVLADPVLDVDTALLERSRMDSELSMRELRGRLLHTMKFELNQLGMRWLDEHQADLCAAISERRAQIMQKLKPFADDLTDRVTDRAQELLDEWNAWSRTHRVVAFDLDRDGIRWEGIDWVANYETQWPHFYLHDDFTAVVKGVPIRQTVPGGEPAPWAYSSPAEQVRAIARFEQWAPTRAELVKKAKELTVMRNLQREEHQNALNNGSDYIPRYIAPTKPAPRDYFSGNVVPTQVRA